MVSRRRARIFTPRSTCEPSPAALRAQRTRAAGAGPAALATGALALSLWGCPGLTDTVADLPVDRDGDAEKRPTPPSSVDGGLDMALDAGADPRPGASARDPDAERRGQEPEADGAVAVANGMCPQELAARTFRRALCACDTVDVSLAGLSTDSFDSRRGPYELGTPLALGGNVAINGQLTAAQPIDIGGDLIVAGPLGRRGLPELSVRGTLTVGGSFSYNQEVYVGQDLRLGADLAGAAPLHVVGNLVQAPGFARTTSATLVIDGEDVRAVVREPEACPCRANQLLDIDAIVAAGKARNDNAEVGLSPDRVAFVPLDQRVELPSDRRLFLSSINVGASVTFVVPGRSVLMIEGDVSIVADLILEMGPESELDLFVGGIVSVGGLALPPASQYRPARVRIYAAGEYFHARAFSVANIYAPKAGAWLLVNEQHGSLFAKQVVAQAGPLRVHYDISVLEGSRICPGLELPDLREPL